MKRRDFLKYVGIGATALMVSPESVMAEKLQMLQPHHSGCLNLSFKPYELNLRHTFTVSKNSRRHTPDVLVFLEYDGIIGYGEASMPPYLGESIESVCTFLSKVDMTQFKDPMRMEEILDYIDHIAEGNRAAKASIDIALHDLVGKMIGRPWWQIWGLSPEKTPCTSFTIGIDTPDIIRQKVAEAAEYKILKVKVGVPNDKLLIETIRSCTDRPICVDANEGWRNKEEALEMVHWLAERGCTFVEQPFHKTMIDETAWLRERSPLPIVADEFLQRLDDGPRAYGVYDAINIKLMKSTGMHEAYQMASAARSMGMKLMIGCMTETSCAISAAAQLSPMCQWADLDGNLLITNDCYTGVKVVEGRITLNNLPGIGIVEN